MKTKEKYTEIIKEVVRNEAVSKDKLVQLAKQYDANKLKIQFYLRKAGVIEALGSGVNRVLIRGQEIAPYVDKVLELTKGGYIKKGLPGNWRNTKKETVTDTDSNTYTDDDYARAQRLYLDTPHITEESAEAINTHARRETTDLQHANYESIRKLEERIAKTEKQPDPSAEHDKRIERLEKLFKEHVDRNSTFMSEHSHQIKELKKKLDKANERISELEERVRHLEDYVEELENSDRVGLLNRLVERLTLVEDYVKLTRKYGKNENKIHINNPASAYYNADKDEDDQKHIPFNLQLNIKIT